MALTPLLNLGDVQVFQGGCADVLAQLPDMSVDAVVTDPPYGLGTPPDPRVVLEHWLAGDDYQHTGGGFMGRSWDSFVPGPAVWSECLRVLKPGGHLLAFFGTRTVDMGGLAIRIAGFDIRDTIAWMYGSGFPKSLDVSKAIDGALGAERADVYQDKPGVTNNVAYGLGLGVGLVERKPATEQAAAWDGWGTALKPAFEPVIVARRPLVGTVAANVLEHGTGAINIDGCRLGDEGGTRCVSRGGATVNVYGDGLNGAFWQPVPGLGRWPANVTLDETAAGHLGEKSRFFYCPKASKRERQGSTHPTVKPLELMRWLVRMVTPPGGVVLDPFAGTGTTLEAARVEGFRAIGVEREGEYLTDIARRLGSVVSD